MIDIRQKAIAAVQSFMAAKGIPGLQLALKADGSEFVESFGQADVENDIPVQGDTRFRIASISKPITATAVLRLRDEGLLSLDVPASTYVKDLPLHLAQLTARQLLTHTSGIRCYADDSEGERIAPCRNLSESLASFEMSPLEHLPGEKFLYSTFGYNLLGFLAEHAADQTFAEILQTRVFNSIGMKCTQIDDPSELIPRRSRGYARKEHGQLVNSKFVCNSYKIPGGGLVSTASDLMAFASSLLTGQVLPRSTVIEMWRPDISGGVAGVDVGLGWTVVSSGETREVYHTGSQHQVSTILYICPERDFAVAILSNLESVKLFELARTLSRLH